MLLIHSASNTVFHEIFDTRIILYIFTVCLEICSAKSALLGDITWIWNYLYSFCCTKHMNYGWRYFVETTWGPNFIHSLSSVGRFVPKEGPEMNKWVTTDQNIFSVCLPNISTNISYCIFDQTQWCWRLDSDVFFYSPRVSKGLHWYISNSRTGSVANKQNRYSEDKWHLLSVRLRIVSLKRIFGTIQVVSRDAHYHTLTKLYVSTNGFCSPTEHCDD